MKYSKATLSGNNLYIFKEKRRIPIGELKDKIYAKSSDSVLICGTIVEGIGNHLSDFDVYVIGDKRPSLSDINTAEHHWIYSGDDNNSVTLDTVGSLYQIFDYVGEGNYAWDTEFWTFDEVLALIQRVELAHTELTAHAFRAERFGYKDAGFLHKILNAIEWQASPRYAELIAKLNVKKLCYVLYRQFANGYPAIRDISGAWHMNQMDLAVYSTRQHVYDQVMSLTFLELLTNPNLKWIFNKTSNLSKESQHINQYFAAFNAMPIHSDVEKRQYVLAGLDLIDAVFDRNRILLDSQPEFLGTQWGLNITEKDRNKRANNHQEFLRQLLYREKMYRPGMPSCREILLQHAK